MAPTDTVTVRSPMSQLYTGTNIMGGRNKQANTRDAHRAAAVITQRSNYPV
jgi:hypothetical protein